MRKRGFALLMALALTLTLAACGGTEAPADETNDTPQETTQPEMEENVSSAEEESGEQQEGDPAQEAETPAEGDTENSNTGSAGNSASNPGTSGGVSASGEQNTSSQKPSQEPTAPQKPAEDESVSQPTQPPAEEAAGSAPEAPAEDVDASTVDLADFCTTVTGDQTWPSLMALEGEAMESFYAGLSAIATRQCVVQVAMISASGDEIALVEVENSSDVQAVKDIFQARIDYQVGDGTAPGGAWYPEPTEMWKNESRIVSNGNFVMLVAHNGADSVVEQFNALFA